MDFSKIASCLTVRFSANKGWKQSATDKTASSKTATDNACERSSVRVVVRLFDNETTSAINSLFTDTRKQLRRFVLDTENDSVYLFPVGNFDSVQSLLKTAQTTLESLLGDLELRYAEYLYNEQARLGALFNADQYPSIDDVTRRTAIRFRFAPLPDSNRFEDLIDTRTLALELRKELESEYVAQQLASETELRSRLVEAVEHASGILYRFHHEAGKRLATDALIAGLTEKVIDCQKLNFTGSLSIEDSCQAILLAMPTEVESLRTVEMADRFCLVIRFAVGLTVAAVPVAAVPVAAVPVAAVPVAAVPVAVAPLNPNVFTPEKIAAFEAEMQKMVDDGSLIVSSNGQLVSNPEKFDIDSFDLY